jgi:hypothetical protein
MSSNALANGEDAGPIESAIEEVEAELAESGVRGSVTRKKPTKVRSTGLNGGRGS